MFASKRSRWFALAGIPTLMLFVTFYVLRGQLYFYIITPQHNFEDESKGPTPDYNDMLYWALYPAKQTGSIQSTTATRDFDVFYIHPTSLKTGDRWNELIEVDKSEQLFAWSKLNQASIFEDCCRIYAPHYRQATLASYWVGENGRKAKELAYEDILAAFDHYLTTENGGRPFFLAGHSQGADHGLRLIKDRILGTELEHRMVASYLIGRPIPKQALAQTHPGIKICDQPDDVSCLVSWVTFGTGSDPKEFLASMEWHFDDGYRKFDANGEFVCVNPLNWHQDETAAPPASHRGAVFYSDHELVKVLEHLTSAACDDRVLLVDDLSGELEYAWNGNYHLYDFNIFYQNIRSNLQQRISGFWKTKMASLDTRSSHH